MSEQFNSVDAGGYVLQPLAGNPPATLPPFVVDPVSPLPNPAAPLPAAPQPAPGGSFRMTQFELMNWSLGFRDETLESPVGVWVIRSLGLNGRWDTLDQILEGRRSASPKAFVEL
jgi:hypothetical protein